MTRTTFVSWIAAGLLAGGASTAQAADPPALPLANPGTVTISLAEYNRLVDRASAPVTPPATIPVGAFVAQADVTLRVEGDLLRGTITLQGDVLRDGPTGVPLVAGGTMLSARAGGQPVPILLERGLYHGVLPAAGPFTVQIEWAAPIATEPGRASAALPAISAGTIHATLDLPGEGSELALERGTITARTVARGRQIVEAAMEPGGAPRVSWSSREASTAAPVRALRLLDDVKTLVTVGESEVRLTAMVDVTVLQGSTGSLALRVPAGFTVAGFTGAPAEIASEADGRIVVTVPAGRRRHQFLVVLERAIGDTAAGQRTLALPSLEGSQRETGDVALEGIGALELAVAETRPLTRIDVAELTPAHASLAREPILAAYRYQRRGDEAVTLAYDVTRFPDAAVLAAGADRATATTLVTAEGRSLTEVSLIVRNQAQPFLKVGLPAGATLLSAEVAGVPVKPAQGTDGLRIPLLRPGFRPSGPYLVSFVYLLNGAAFAGRGDASLALARLDLPVAWLEWELFLPDRLEASRFDGPLVPKALVPAHFAVGQVAPVESVSEIVTNTPDAKTRPSADQRQNEAPSLNVQNLQRRASGVLPVRLDVPRTGRSHTFVRPLVMDEETRLAFHYKLKK